jgi:hypothetical protein
MGALEESHAPYSATYIKLRVPHFVVSSLSLLSMLTQHQSPGNSKRYNGLRMELIVAAILKRL